MRRRTWPTRASRVLAYPCPVSNTTTTQVSRGLVWPAPQWLALFYDLAFAAGIIAIAGSYGYDHSLVGAVWFATAYGIIASAWVLTGGATGSFATRQRPVTTPIVVLIVIQMAAVLMLAVASGDTIASSGAVFDILLAVLLTTCLGLGWLARDGAHAMPTTSIILTVAAMLTLAGSWLLPDGVDVVAWLLALAALAVAAGLVSVDQRIDVHRFAHRLGELTIIIIGEILVKMALTAGDESLWAVELAELMAALALLVVAFWAYFTGPVGVTVLTSRRRVVWVSTHWALHVGLLGLAVGLSKLLVDSMALDDPGNVLALLTGPTVLVVGSLAMLDWVTGSRRWRLLAAATVGVAVVAAVALNWDVAPTVAAYVAAAVPLVALAISNRPDQAGGVGEPAGDSAQTHGSEQGT